MNLSVLRQIVDNIRGNWYKIMIDETTDLSNTEQMLFCLRYVDDDLLVHEEVIGLYCLDILLRLNLTFEEC